MQQNNEDKKKPVLTLEEKNALIITATELTEKLQQTLIACRDAGLDVGLVLVAGAAHHCPEGKHDHKGQENFGICSILGKSDDLAVMLADASNDSPLYEIMGMSNAKFAGRLLRQRSGSMPSFIEQLIGRGQRASNNVKTQGEA